MSESLGVYIALLEDEQHVLKPHWLYLNWDDAQASWIMHSLAIQYPSRPPSLAEATFKQQPAPEQLKILLAPHFRNGESYCFRLAEKIIHAVRLNTDQQMIHDWSYHIDSGDLKSPPTPKLSLQDFPTFEQRIQIQDIESRYRDWQDSFVANPLINSISHSFIFDFDNEFSTDAYWHELETHLQELQAVENKKYLQQFALIHFGGRTHQLTVYLQLLSDLIQVHNILVAARASNPPQDLNTLWQNISDEQLKSIVLTYRDHKKNQLLRLAKFCDKMSLERAAALVASFSDEELFALVASNAARRDRLESLERQPNHCFSTVARHLPQARFQWLVEQLQQQHWDLTWASPKQPENALALLFRQLQPTQQQWLLQNGSIVQLISTLSCKGYAALKQFVTTCQLDNATKNMLLAHLPPSAQSINSLASYFFYNCRVFMKRLIMRLWSKCVAILIKLPPFLLPFIPLKLKRYC